MQYAEPPEEVVEEEVVEEEVVEEGPLSTIVEGVGELASEAMEDP